MSNNLLPVGGWVLIRPDARVARTASGIIIPESVTEYGHTAGTVISASETYTLRDKNVTARVPVSAGQRVMYRDYLKELETVDVDGEPCCFIYVEDIVLILEDDHV